MSIINSWGGVQTTNASNTITGTSFGAKYTAFRDMTRFDDQTDDVDLGMIHWPGGYLSEVDNGRYGFEFDELFNVALGSGRPGLQEVFEYASANNLAVAITLPTARYQDSLQELENDASGFFDALYSGAYGPLPDKLIIEIGNEFYGAFEGANEVAKALDYTQVVNTYANLIAAAEARYGVDPDQIEYTVQIGQTAAGNDAILDNISDTALLNTDYLSHHRYPFEARGADARIEDVEHELQEFGAAITALGGDAPSVFVSEYNSASITRNEAATKYLREHDDDPSVTRASLDLDGRSNQDFEQFYQDQLGIRDYGLEQAENVLQTFSEYQGIGAEAMTSYGWDSAYAGRNTFEGTDGESYTFAGGAIQDMMAESLQGTRVLNWYQGNDHGRGNDGDVSTFGFDSADKLVIFLTGPEDLTGTEPMNLSLAGLGTLTSVRGESLTADTPSNWKSLFDIPNSPGVDQSNEAETFAVANREALDFEVIDGRLHFDFQEPGEVVRLTFARTEQGEAEIRQWHGDSKVDLDIQSPAPAVQTLGGDEPVLPVVEQPYEEPEPEAEPDYMAGADDGGGMGAEGLLVGLILPILLAMAGGM